MSSHVQPAARVGLLGDTTRRDYSRKLALFNSFAEPELRHVIAGLGLKPGMRILDAGCGTGAALGWLSQEVGPEGLVVGAELASAHIASARLSAANHLLLQADLAYPPLRPGCLDLVWCVNSINHLHEPVAAIGQLAGLLRPGGRIVLGQSSLLPDMLFAWDARLERLTNEAVRRYYRDRYRLEERDLTAIRSLVGIARQANLQGISARTHPIERIHPLSGPDQAYLLGALFRDTWGERLRPYLSAEDYSTLVRLCDPNGPDFALRRPDFHFLQTFTVVVGSVG